MDITLDTDSRHGKYLVLDDFGNDLPNFRLSFSNTAMSDCAGNGISILEESFASCFKVVSKVGTAVK